MHIRLPDKHVANHFCLQAFLSEQSFPSLPMSCCSSTVNYFAAISFKVLDFQLVYSNNTIARTSLRLLISFRVTLKVFSASRSMILLSSLELQLVLCQKRCSVAKIISLLVILTNFWNVLATILLNLLVNIMCMFVT